MGKLIRLLAALPRSIWFDFRYLPFRQAIHVPLLLACNVRIREMKGKIQLDGPIRFGITHIGFHRVHVLDEHKSHTILSIAKGAKLHLHSTAKIGQGTKIIVRPNAKLIFAAEAYTSGRSEIVCYKSITLGVHVGISWDTFMTDSDTHDIYDTPTHIMNEDKPIVLEDQVWVGCRSTILKGTHVAQGCIIGAGSLLSGSYLEPNMILVGHPAKTIKKIDHYTW